MRILILSMALASALFTAAEGYAQGARSAPAPGDGRRGPILSPDLLTAVTGHSSPRERFLDLDKGPGKPKTRFASAGHPETTSKKRSRTGRGALIGLVVGAAAGAITGQVVCADGNCESSSWPGDISGAVSLSLGLGGALVGAGIGAVVGSFIKTEP